MSPERAIAFMRAFKAEYDHEEVDEACNLAIYLIEKYKNSFWYKLKKYIYKKVRWLNE